jgi:hypothetical protein
VLEEPLRSSSFPINRDWIASRECRESIDPGNDQEWEAIETKILLMNRRRKWAILTFTPNNHNNDEGFVCPYCSSIYNNIGLLRLMLWMPNSNTIMMRWWRCKQQRPKQRTAAGIEAEGKFSDKENLSPSNQVLCMCTCHRYKKICIPFIYCCILCAVCPRDLSAICFDSFLGSTHNPGCPLQSQVEAVLLRFLNVSTLVANLHHWWARGSDQAFYLFLNGTIKE